jgi:hypothetical protein
MFAGPASLAFRFELAGEMDRLVLPGTGDATRRDGLWQHTCCEAFVTSRSGGYVELNFASSGDWAAYRFETYRKRQLPDPALPPPVIAANRRPERFVLEARVNMAAIDDVDPAAGVGVGLAVVAEETDGRRSYWALRHDRDLPDFHQAGSFLGTPINATRNSPGKAHPP